MTERIYLECLSIFRTPSDPALWLESEGYPDRLLTRVIDFLKKYEFLAEVGKNYQITPKGLGVLEMQSFNGSWEFDVKPISHFWQQMFNLKSTQIALSRRIENLEELEGAI